MNRRAIVLVPGFGRKEQNQARDQLVRLLTYYGEGWKVTEVEEPDSLPAGAVSLCATDYANGEKRIIDVYEAYWGDLTPDWSNESPWARFKRGVLLVVYWLIGGVGKAWRQGEHSARTSIAMAVAGLLLVLWWLAVLVFLLQAVTEGGVEPPKWVTILGQDEAAQAGPDDTAAGAAAAADNAANGQEESGAPATAEGVAVSDADAAPAGWWDRIVASLPSLLGSTFVALLLWVWSTGILEQFANLAASVKAYLRDEVFGEDGVGIRAKSRARVRAVLDRLTIGDGKGEYTDIYVVGHSLGGAIAVDALAECGEKLSDVVLFTWGSALGMLTQQEPLVEREIYKVYMGEPRLRNWIDVVIQRDYMASKVPVPRRFAERSGVPGLPVGPAFPDAVEPKIPFGLSDPAALHEAYYRCEEAAILLLEPAGKLPDRPPVP